MARARKIRPAMAARMDALAELVADGAPVISAGRSLGMTKGEAASTWRAIVRNLGAQAA